MIDFKTANINEIENVAMKIDGYCFPSPSKPGGAIDEFERAKKERIGHLIRELEMTKEMTFDVFITKKCISSSMKRFSKGLD